MLEVREIVGARYKKYVLQNILTGIIIDRRFWTVRGARRKARQNINNLNKTIRSLNSN